MYDIDDIIYYDSLEDACDIVDDVDEETDSITVSRYDCEGNLIGKQQCALEWYELQVHTLKGIKII